ncbi:MAG: S9 family peptidase [Ignavibacteriales bacterium]|nr:S9 family peptidase [Ignavibacteriales bacterium]MCF8306590.1 S9 family peptidase [Ignavibacteriales bacterium]MCF8316389.1 S9 family peptidase [Ignavibacteriales bacterium]MCF8437653.1 S9 family peptidase [Ignavibacteriales bacterium]
MKARSACLLFFLVFTFFLSAQSKIPMSPEDLYSILKVSDAQISPDGKQIVYVVSNPDLTENKYNSDIWIVSASSNAQRQLTRGGGSDYHPRWYSDSRTIAFLSDRPGNTEIFKIDISGGEAEQVTFLDSYISTFKLSQDDNKIILQIREVPDNSDIFENNTEEELPYCSARTIDHLLFRQWDSWLGDERNMLFLFDPHNNNLLNITNGEHDSPPVSLSTGRDFDISRDNSLAAYVQNTDPVTAISTNHDIFLSPVDGSAERRLTNNKAWDAAPLFSPGGKYLAYLSMAKPGYESDRAVLTVMELNSLKTIRISEQYDRSVDQFVWLPDESGLIFTAEDGGRGVIMKCSVEGKITELSREGFNSSISIDDAGKKLVFTRSYNHQPPEVFLLDLSTRNESRITNHNKDFIANFDLPKLEEFKFRGGNNDEVHGFIQYPPGFDKNKKYPAVLSIHGGPQNMWADKFMFTWFTFPLVSSPGYVGIFINPRGSTGYSSKFREEVSRDYGGLVHEDLIKGLDYVLANYNFIDSAKLAAIGGSFGGYSVNWIIGKTDRFKCTVSHAGIYNLTSFYGATEELWFPEWDMGKSPWEEPGLYDIRSPHKYADNFKTPTLVTHGELDYRVPFAESLQLFTALQRQGIDSRLVVFPDEGHVISGLQNNVRWWREIHAWLERYLK